jgi:hypothetical protein
MCFEPVREAATGQQAGQESVGIMHALPTSLLASGSFTHRSRQLLCSNTLVICHFTSISDLTPQWLQHVGLSSCDFFLQGRMRYTAY